MVLIIVGKSGTGKTEIVTKHYAEKHGFEIIKSKTTRPKRNSDGDNPDHVFISDEDFDAMDFLEETVYDGYRYGATQDDYRGDKIITIDAKKALSLKNKIANAYIIYVKSMERIRRKRLMERYKNDAALTEGRINTDKKEFDGAEKIADYIVRNNSSIESLKLKLDEVLYDINNAEFYSKLEIDERTTFEDTDIRDYKFTTKDGDELHASYLCIPEFVTYKVYVKQSLSDGYIKTLSFEEIYQQVNIMVQFGDLKNENRKIVLKYSNGCEYGLDVIEETANKYLELGYIVELETENEIVKITKESINNDNWKLAVMGE